MKSVIEKTKIQLSDIRTFCQINRGGLDKIIYLYLLRTCGEESGERRSNQIFNKIFTFAIFNFQLAFLSFTSRGKFLAIYQPPWPFGLGIFWTPLVMPFNPICQVIGGTDVIGTIILGLDYVNIVRHKQKSLSRLWIEGNRLNIKVAGTTRLEPPTFPLFKRDGLIKDSMKTLLFLRFFLLSRFVAGDRSSNWSVD